MLTAVVLGALISLNIAITLWVAERVRLLAMQQTRMEVRTMQQFDDLVAEVAATKGVQESAITLIQGLDAKLAALQDAPTAEAVQALRDDLKTSSDALAAAVAASPQ